MARFFFIFRFSFFSTFDQIRINYTPNYTKLLMFLNYGEQKSSLFINVLVTTIRGEAFDLFLSCDTYAARQDEHVLVFMVYPIIHKGF